MTTPRIALLTLWPPDARYKILRRYADWLPADRFAWCSLQPCTAGHATAFRHQAFPLALPHWRLRSTWVGHYYVHALQGRAVAARVAAWVRDFKADVLWVLPELAAADVGWRLQRLSGLPLHVTAHDAPETARSIVPPLFYPWYARAVNRAFLRASSADAISAGMREYLLERYANLTRDNTLVFPPSVDRALMASVEDCGIRWRQDRTRRVGICGSMRVELAQWTAFLRLLEGLPHPVEIVSLAYRDRFFENVTLPANVRVSTLPYAEDDAAVVRGLRAARVDACYLGLYRGASRLLFGRTSLSAKLAAYAAAALPVIVDAEPDSMAWQLVESSGAGVCLTGALEQDRAAVAGLWQSSALWLRRAAGAHALCRTEFDLASNCARFAACLGATAQHRAPGVHDR